jgi:sugar lactone lactonase YvrE
VSICKCRGARAGPDGIAVDERGNLVVAQIGSGRCGCLVLRVSHYWRMPSNVASGGEDGTTLCITEAQTGTILAAEMPYKGADISRFEPRGSPWSGDCRFTAVPSLANMLSYAPCS